VQHWSNEVTRACLGALPLMHSVLSPCHTPSLGQHILGFLTFNDVVWDGSRRTNLCFHCRSGVIPNLVSTFMCLRAASRLSDRPLCGASCTRAEQLLKYFIQAKLSTSDVAKVCMSGTARRSKNKVQQRCKKRHTIALDVRKLPMK